MEGRTVAVRFFVAQIGSRRVAKLTRNLEKQNGGEIGSPQKIQMGREWPERSLSMNKIIEIGRLTRDPEVRYSQGATPTAVARFSIAVNRRFKKEGDPDADFFNCVAFGKQGEFAEKYLRKGTKVVVVGRLENDNYTNKDGQQVYGNRIVVEEIEFGESKAAASGSGTAQNGGNGQQASAGAGDGFMNIPDGIDEELPFN